MSIYNISDQSSLNLVEEFPLFLEPPIFEDDADPWESVWAPLYDQVVAHKQPFVETIKKCGLSVISVKGRERLKLGFDQKGMDTIRFFERIIKAISQNSATSRSDVYRQIQSIYYAGLKPFVEVIENRLNEKELAEVRGIFQNVRLRTFNAYNFREKYAARWIAKTKKTKLGEFETKIDAEKQKIDTSALSKELAALMRSSPALPDPEGNKLVPEAVENWIRNHENQHFARKFISFLTYRSFKKFEQRLQSSIAAFNRYIALQLSEEREYAIIIPEKFTKKSNTWVTQVALPHLAQASIPIFQQGKELPQLLEQRPKIRHLVLFDDMACSGLQMVSIASGLHHDFPKLQIAIIVPFMRMRAAENIRLTSNAWIAPYERLYSAADFRRCFSEDELMFLDKMAKGSYGLHHMTFIRFAHKLPDNISTFEDTLQNLVKYTIPPYKKD